ncbi:hypothetical protein [Amycolatopsis plumensis]|uniref:Uncharacterized protein n=1 Tax=Amycolatopsis plumensis TaxID=236508 RepID=A0ABV5U8F7_9PSEU
MTTYLEQEVEYWRARAKAAEQRLREAADFYPDNPPEPPVGTEYGVPGSDVVAWRRTDEGWFCAGEACRNCPVEWGEVWDRDLSLVSREAVLERRLP